MQGLDDEARTAASTLATRPAEYKPGAFARLADAYDAAGAPEKAASTRRIAASESALKSFAKSTPERQRATLATLPAGELRDNAEAIMAQQADALARDPFAAGAGLYTDEGRPAPIDDIAARVRQARIVADRTGLPVPPYSADEIADMRRILADGPPERRAAVLVRYQALPDDMKAALKPRLLPVRAPAEPAPAGETGATFRIGVASGGPSKPNDAQASAPVPDAASAGGQGVAPPAEPPPGGPEYQAADVEARRIASVPEGQPSAPRGTSLAGTAAPAAAPAGGVLGEIGQAAAQGAKSAAGWMGRAASVSAGAIAGAVPLILTPTNTQAELHPLGEGLRVRTAPGQGSATVQRRVDDGLLGTGIGAKWIDLPVAAEWSTRGPNRQRIIAIDRQGLEQVIGREAADAALGGNGIVMATPPSDEMPSEGEQSEGVNESDNSSDPDDPKEPNETKPSPPSRNRLPTQKAQLEHIFTEEEGHLPDTPENRKLLEDLANDRGTASGPDKYGNTWFKKELPNGTQVWTSVRNGIIQNGGLNTSPKAYNPQTGLSSPAPRSSPLKPK